MAFVVSRAQRTLLSPSTVAAIVSSCRFVSFRSQALNTQHERAKQCERERERARWSASNFESSQCSSGYWNGVSVCVCACKPLSGALFLSERVTLNWAQLQLEPIDDTTHNNNKLEQQLHTHTHTHVLSGHSHALPLCMRSRPLSLSRLSCCFNFVLVTIFWLLDFFLLLLLALVFFLFFDLF